MATYPGAIYSPATLTDGIDDVLASHQNVPNAELVAIETELGTNPKTIDDTVAPAAPTSVGNLLDMFANIVKTISGSTTWQNAAAAAIMKSIGTAKGDIIAFTASGTPTRLAMGTTGQVLTVSTSTTSGLSWVTPAAAATWGGITGTLSNQTDLQYALNPADGIVINGKISPSISAGGLVLALKTMAGNNPSTSEPVYFRIGDTLRTISTSLSVTVAQGTTNPFNSGSTNANGPELGTKEIDYFSYLSWVSTSSAAAIGYGRFPHARVYSDFSGTLSNEKYGAFSSTPAATDNVINFGRFAATVSTGSTYTWTVPTYTSVNLIQGPIFETRWLDWVPAGATTSGTFTSLVISLAKYKIQRNLLKYQLYVAGTLGGAASQYVTLTLPFDALNSAVTITTGALLFADGSATPGIFGGGFILAGTPDKVGFYKYNQANWHTSGTGTVDSSGFYEI